MGNETLGYTTQTQCSFQGKSVPCDRNQAPGTKAEITCIIGYQQSVQVEGSSVLTCLEGGKWDGVPIKCIPICGRIRSKSLALVIGGQISDVSEVPWMAIIYKNNKEKGFGQHCAGSILTKKIIISASHCFFKNEEMEWFSKDEFRIVVGKTKRNYTADELLPTQSFEISDVYPNSRYNGYVGFYISDIALVILKESIEFKLHILPICIDLEEKYGLDKIVPAGDVGLVAGWGFTKAGGMPSRVLKSIEMPVIDFFQCRNEAGSNFESFVTFDKFCSGFKNGSGVCKGKIFIYFKCFFKEE